MANFSGHSKTVQVHRAGATATEAFLWVHLGACWRTLVLGP
jgi:hypothetical protein